MKSVFTNNEIYAHWGKQDHGRNGSHSMSFQDDMAFSYAAPIGRFAGEGRVLLSLTYFSNTTTSHQLALRKATRHLDQIYAYLIGGKYTDIPHTRNKDYWEGIRTCALETLAKHPRRHKTLEEELRRVSEQYNDYNEFFDIGWDVMPCT